jgi:hypothetical protein
MKHTLLISLTTLALCTIAVVIFNIERLLAPDCNYGAKIISPNGHDIAFTRECGFGGPSALAGEVRFTRPPYILSYNVFTYLCPMQSAHPIWESDSRLIVEYSCDRVTKRDKSWSDISITYDAVPDNQVTR